MLVIGLTGGIGSGKSEVAKCFVALGMPVIDTDFIAHQLTAPGMPALPMISQALGPDYIAADGTLNRAKLRNRIFTDPSARRALENILHPLIRTKVAEELLKHLGVPYQVVVVPLLFETGEYQDMVDRVLVVDCNEEQQVRRASARSGLSPDDVRAIMAVQLPRMERNARADDIILNESGLSELAKEVYGKHEKYINTCTVRQSIT